MTKKQLLDIIERADRWYVNDEGSGFIACEDDDDIEHKVSNKGLQKIHPHLSFALTGLIDWSLTKRIKELEKNRRTPDYELAYAEPDLVESTRALLESGGFRFINTDRKSVLLCRITDVHLHSENPEFITVEGEVVETNHFCVGEQRIPFVVKTYADQVTLSAASLEEQYPGALGRLLVGQELGVEHDTLMRHVFTALPTAQASVVLDKVNFE